MTNYIARHGAQKKKNILRQRERELRGEISRGASLEKISRRAERLRAAQQAVIKALMYEVDPVTDEGAERTRSVQKHLKEQADFWDKVRSEEIIRIYSKDTDEDLTTHWKRIGTM